MIQQNQVLLRAAIAALATTIACSDATESTREGVGSAPPFGQGQQEAPVDRERMALEAFDRWAPLLAGGAVDDARALCEGWLTTADLGHHVEAHKCLANIAIATMRQSTGQAPPIHWRWRATHLERRRRTRPRSL